MEVTFCNLHSLALGLFQARVNSRIAVNHYINQIAMCTGRAHGSGNIQPSPALVSQMTSCGEIKLPFYSYVPLITNLDILADPVVPVVRTTSGSWLQPNDMIVASMKTGLIEEVLGKFQALVDDAYNNLELKLGFLSDESLEAFTKVLKSPDSAVCKALVVDAPESQAGNVNSRLTECIEFMLYLEALKSTKRKTQLITTMRQRDAGKIAASGSIAKFTSIPNRYNSMGSLRMAETVILATRYPELVMYDADYNFDSLMSPHISISYSGRAEPSYSAQDTLSNFVMSTKAVTECIGAIRARTPHKDEDAYDLTPSPLDKAVDEEVEAFTTAASIVMASSIQYTEQRFQEVGRRLSNGAMGLGGGF